MKITTIGKSLETGQITQEQLDAINRFTRRELAKNEVFVFSVILCDNEIDRDLEQFPRESLKKLAELYIGKTGVFDHKPNAENQSARIFDAEVLAGDTENSCGEGYYFLKAWAYMVRCDKNADLILEIDAGIKKEVSVGCSVEKTLCSVCGAEQKTGSCIHKKGTLYDGKPCYHMLVNPTDAYEWSFVAVPAQKNAGVVKGYGDSFKMLDRHETTFEKLFSADSDILLQKAQIDLLAREYISLKNLAAAGEEYASSLRRETVKMMLLAQPELDSGTTESVANRMDLAQLKEFARAFGKTALQKLPVKPQLAGSGYKEPQADSQFQI